MFKKIKGALVAIPTIAGAVVANAASTLPAGVSTGIADAQATGTEVIGLLAAAGAAVWLVAKVLRKFGVMM